MEDHPKKESNWKPVDQDLHEAFLKLKAIDAKSPNRHAFIWAVAEGTLKIKAHYQARIDLLEDQVESLQKQLRAKKSQANLFG